MAEKPILLLSMGGQHCCCCEQWNLENIAVPFLFRWETPRKHISCLPRDKIAMCEQPPIVAMLNFVALEWRVLRVPLI